MRASRVLTALATGIALVALATGCSMSILDGDPTKAPQSSGTSPERAPEGTPDAGDQGSSAPSDGLSRDELIAGAAKVMRCDGELTILDDAVAVYVEGPCDRLILNTRGSQIVTDDVAFLEVIGDANLVLSGEVDELLVNGTGNTVHWTGATPTIQDVGSVNVLTAG